MNYGEPFDESELKVFIQMVAKERLIREYKEIVAELIKIDGMLHGAIPCDTMSGDLRMTGIPFGELEERKAWVTKRFNRYTKELRRRRIVPYDKFSFRWFTYVFFGYW